MKGQAAAVGPPGVWQGPGRNHHIRWVLGYSPPGRLLRAWLILLEQRQWSLTQATLGWVGSPVEQGGQDSHLSMLGVCPPNPASPSGPEEAALFPGLQGFSRAPCVLPGSATLERSSQAGHPHRRTTLEAEVVLGPELWGLTGRGSNSVRLGGATGAASRGDSHTLELEDCPRVVVWRVGLGTESEDVEQEASKRAPQQ